MDVCSNQLFVLQDIQDWQGIKQKGDNILMGQKVLFFQIWLFYIIVQL